MPMNAAEISVGSFRSFPDPLSPRMDAALRRPERDFANERFEARRRAIAGAGNRSPIERVAAFLVAISRNNSHEGRDPAAIPETLTCGFVADLLGFPIDTLASLLKLLEERGLVAPDGQTGLRLTDLARLEKLARA